MAALPSSDFLSTSMPLSPFVSPSGQEINLQEGCAVIRLPTEILSEVVEALSPEEQAAFAGTCRRAYTICSSVRFKHFLLELPSLRSIVATPQSEEDKEAVARARRQRRLFMRQARNIKHLTIRLPSKFEYSDGNQGSGNLLRLTDSYSMFWLAWQFSMKEDLQYLEVQCWGDGRSDSRLPWTVPDQNASIFSMVISNPMNRISSTLRKLVVWWTAPERLPTVTHMPALEELCVNFSHSLAYCGFPVIRPVADLRHLPRLRTIILSTGFELDTGPERINCTFKGFSHSVRKLVVESDTPNHGREFYTGELYDQVGARPLPRLLARFPSLRHLRLMNVNVGGQVLAGVKLPLLETLESVFCSPGAIRGMALPSIRNLSVVDTFDSGRALLRDLPFDSLQALYVCLERNIIKSREATVLDLSEFYGRYCQYFPHMACLVEGDVSAPPVSSDNLRYLPGARIRRLSIDEAAVLQHGSRRRHVLKELGMEFRDPGDQEYGVGPALPDPNEFYWSMLQSEALAT